MSEREATKGYDWADREASCLLDQGLRPSGPWTCGDELALPLCEATDEGERRAEAARINAYARARWDELVDSYSVECAYCHLDVTPYHLGAEVPDADDDDAWEDLAKRHASTCEWIRTRAHRLDA